jgi:hypothetical protein
MRATEKTIGSTINHNREQSSGNAMFNPTQPFLSKTTSADMVISHYITVPDHPI